MEPAHTTHPPTLEIDLETAHRHVQNLLQQKAQLALLISQQREEIFAHAINCPFTCFPFPSSEHHTLLRHTSNLSIIQNRLERSYRCALDRLTSAKPDLAVTLHLTLRHAWICPITCTPDKSPFHQNLDRNLTILNTQINELQEQHRQVVQESLAYLGGTEPWLPSA